MKCPHCGQERRFEKLGVELPPLKSALVDLIAAAGEIGATSQELRQDLYRGYANERSLVTVRMHMLQINDVLVSTDWRIVCDGRGTGARWRLMRRPAKSADLAQQGFYVAHGRVAP
jgi:hypothetical protein